MYFLEVDFGKRSFFVRKKELRELIKDSCDFPTSLSIKYCRIVASQEKISILTID